MSERPLAEQLAREVLRDPATHGWLAPLAREYLAEIAEERMKEKHPLRVMATCCRMLGGEHEFHCEHRGRALPTSVPA